MNDGLRFIASHYVGAIPSDPADDSVGWAEHNVRLPGSARADSYSRSHTPWTADIIARLSDPEVRVIDLAKPIQSGGSVVGEIALCYWIANSSSGDIQYNWEDDVKAIERWDKRIYRILRACKAINKWPTEYDKIKKGLVIFDHCNLTVQGSFNPSNLDSDSIKFQVNEEIHNWEPGRLAKAINRTAAFWDSKVLNISNSGQVGDQLYQSYMAGTQQEWTVLCPGCGTYHAMRTRWEDERPELGGLRYDSDGNKLDNGDYDFRKIEETIRYQFPCGHEVRDTIAGRRALSASGRYTDPVAGSSRAHLSFRYDSVAVDYIPWVSLIRQKHDALRAIRYGDPEPWKRYLQERENIFWDPSVRPTTKKLHVDKNVHKHRDGLTNRAFRGMTIDKQGGQANKGESPHYWVVIRDWMQHGDSQLVFEGRVTTDEELILLQKRYDVESRFVLIDSGFSATHVYRLCAEHDYTALKGEGREFYPHIENGLEIRRIYSPIQFIDPFIGSHDGREGESEIALILYSKQGIRDRLAWLRASDTIRWVVPEDVTEDYRHHLVSEEQEEYRIPATNQIAYRWKKIDKRNDLFVCECYQVLLAELVGVLKK